MASSQRIERFVNLRAGNAGVEPAKLMEAAIALPEYLSALGAKHEHR